MADIDEILYRMPQGLLNWYPFEKGARALYIDSAGSSLGEALKEAGLDVTCASAGEAAGTEFKEAFKGAFAYVAAAKLIEEAGNPVRLLKAIYDLLDGSGVLLLGTENRLGLKYFAGEKDPYTGRLFDGLEGYYRVSPEMYSGMEGRCYSRNEILGFMEACGWKETYVYSVMPGLSSPQMLYAQDFIPEERLANRLFPRYRQPDTVFLDEEKIYDGLMKDGILHGMAGAFLFECTKGRKAGEALQCTLSMDRGREEACSTVVWRNREVSKRAVYPEGREKHKRLMENHADLSKRGIKVIDGTFDGDTYRMPFVDAPLASNYLKDLLLKDSKRFIQEMDRFRELILNSSVHVNKEGERIVLEKGYPDMVPLNAFYIDGEFVFFDQEFMINGYPADAVVFRMVIIVYESDMRLEEALPQRFFWKRYGLEENAREWIRLSRSFTDSLRNQEGLAEYNRRHARNDETVWLNRHRMHWPEKEYEELFYNPLKGLEDKALYLFGAGRYAEKFIAMYRRDYEIAGIFDNNIEKHGTTYCGIQVLDPADIAGLSTGSYRIVICMKDYGPVLEQLRRMGVEEVSVYGKEKIYPGRQACAIQPPPEGAKKYHIGYVAGVFDLYHLGHLNMFRRAKEQCDYLIVGIVTDEGVRDFKGTEPYVPFDERVEMVRSCRYVDEVVEIPYYYRDTQEMFEKYHFDVQFSGSDYENNPGWLAKKRYLEEHGSELVFFPYTMQTSSTKIKRLIERGLVE